jgi:hypothetical protein
MGLAVSVVDMMSVLVGWGTLKVERREESDERPLRN